MAVLAVFILSDVFNASGSTVGVHCSGKSTDASVDFTGATNGTIGVAGLSWDSYTLNSDIEDAVRTRLQSAPYSMTFGAGDTVRMLPAHD